MPSSYSIIYTSKFVTATVSLDELDDYLIFLVPADLKDSVIEWLRPLADICCRMSVSELYRNGMVDIQDVVGANIDIKRCVYLNCFSDLIHVFFTKSLASLAMLFKLTFVV